MKKTAPKSIWATARKACGYIILAPKLPLGNPFGCKALPCLKRPIRLRSAYRQAELAEICVPKQQLGNEKKFLVGCVSRTNGGRDARPTHLPNLTYENLQK